MEVLAFVSAVTMGLLGGAHCIGMCGGIIGALTMAVEVDDVRRRWLLLLLYNIGRIVSYVVIAVLFYVLIDSLEDYFALSVMRYVAGILLIAMGLYIANWWKGLVYLEKIGSFLWRWLQPLSRSLIPVKKNWQALALGMIWGWLPCGLIYTALAYSATAVSASQAGLIMFSFAVGTLPAVLVSGLVAERIMELIRSKLTRSVMAVVMIVFGVWTLFNNHTVHHQPNSSNPNHNHFEHH